jgi:hypothetical protein
MKMENVGAWLYSRVAVLPSRVTVLCGRICKGCPFFFRHEERRATPDSDDKRYPHMAHFLASDQASFINFLEQETEQKLAEYQALWFVPNTPYV